MSIKNIDWYIQKVNNEKTDGGLHRTKAYAFKEDGVILLQKYQDNFEELQKEFEKCKKLGISVPAYIDYKIDDDNHAWILEELAVGKEFATLVNNENGQEIVSNIPYEHIEKYFRDSYLLGINGIGVEPRRRNIFYDVEQGFTTIDLEIDRSNEDISELETVNNFFQMYKGVLFVSFSNDKKGKEIKEKTVQNIMKAFESSHPLFERYKRWIYRGDSYFGEFLRNHDYNLTLNPEECKEFNDIIQQLIDQISNKKINGKEDLFLHANMSYINMLEGSIAYYPDFDLYDTSKKGLKEFIYESVNSRIKSKFLLGERDNEFLQNLYFQIRKQEIDPVYIYDVTSLEEYIKEELDEYDRVHAKDKEEITPSKVAKNALGEVTRSDVLEITEIFGKQEKSEIFEIK